MGCEQYQELISALLDGELSPSEQRELERHLSGCADCAAFYRAVSGLSESLAQDLAEPPERLHENIMASLRREEILRRNRRRRIITLTATAACLALAVGLSVRGGLLRPDRRAAQQDSYSLAASSFPMGRSEVLPLEESAAEAEEDAAVREAPAPAPAESAAAESEAAAAESPAAPAQNTAAGASAVKSAPASDRAAVGSGTSTGSRPEGLTRLELSDWLTRQTLTDFLGGEPASAEEAASAVLLCEVVTADGEGRGTVRLYRSGRAILYGAPDGGLRRADCNWAMLLRFLSRGGEN